MLMVSPHILDIRWRIAAEEKAGRMPPAQSPYGNWYARKLDDQWGIIQHISDRLQNARFVPVSDAEFAEVNSRYRD